MRYQFGPFQLDAKTGALSGPEGEVRLRPQTFRLLETLVLNYPTILSRETLLDEVWGTEHISSGSLPQAISELRQALGDDPQSPRYIETVHRRGYRFIAPVTTASTISFLRSSKEVAELAALEDEQEAPPPAASAPRGLPRATVAGIVAGIAAAVLLAGGLLSWWLLRPGGTGGTDGTGATAADLEIEGQRPTVAVLGFKNLSPEAEVAWMSAALAEMIGQRLASGGELRVLPGETVARARQDLDLDAADILSPRDLQRLHRHLAAQWVVLGSFLRQVGDTQEVDVQVRLQAAPGGRTLMMLTESAPADQLASLAARAGEQLRRGLGVDGGGEAVSGMPAEESLDGSYYDALERLRAFDPLTARDLLRQAAARTPDSPRVHSALADAWQELGYRREARAAAQRALELGSDLPAAERRRLEARSLELAGQPAAAAEIYRELLAERPDELETGLHLAAAQVAAGNGQGALAVLEDLRRRPHPPAWDPHLDLAEAEAAESVSRFTRQQEAARRAREAGEAIDARLLVARALLLEGRALMGRGRLPEAGEVLARARTAFAALGNRRREAEARSFLGRQQARRGDFPGARAQVEQAVATAREIGDQQGLGRDLSLLGGILIYVGEPDEARRTLEEAAAVCAEIGDSGCSADVLLQQAELDFRAGDRAASRRLLEQALDTWVEAGERRGQARALGNLGRVLADDGDPEGARRAFEQTLALFRDMDDPDGQAKTLSNLGALVSSQGDLDRAAEFQRQAVELYEAAGNRQEAMRLLFNQASLDFRRGLRPQQVAEDMARCLEFYRQGGERLGGSHIGHQLGVVRLYQGDLAGARQALDVALEESRATQDRGLEGRILTTLGQLEALADDPAAARRRYLQALDLADAQRPEDRTDLRWQLALLDLPNPQAAGDLRRLLAEITSQETAGLPSQTALVRASLARALAVSGQSGEARRLLADLAPKEEELSRSGIVFALQLGLEIGRAELALGEEVAERTRRLLAESSRAGLRTLEVEVRLLQAEAGLETGGQALADLEEQARQLGLESAARQAARLRGESA